MDRPLLSLALAAAAFAGAGEAAAFRYGVAAGEIQPTSALVWTRAPSAGAVTLEVARDAAFRRVVVRRRLRALAANDLTVQARVSGLRPGSAYRYRFRRRAEISPVGRFRTAPSAPSGVRVEFAISGDADGTPVPATGRPFYNQFETYAAMAAEGNHFNINLGDTIYSDSGVNPQEAPALTVPAKWRKYRENLDLDALRRLRAASSLYSHWDDHEFVNDFSVAEHGQALYEAGVKAFRDYAPVSYSRDLALYRSFRWGRHLELFFLDERSFRDAKASVGGVCNTPGGTLDLAPTAPQAVRNGFATLAPSLAAVVQAACVERIGDPNRTMLGRRQYEAFTAGIRRSTATFKVIVNEVPVLQLYALPYDRWEGYEAERRRLLEFLRDNVRNVVFLTTDTHATLVGEARLQTLEPGGPVGTGILEAVVGPVAASPFVRQIDRITGRPGAGETVTFVFLKAPPPRGPGLQCAVTDTFGYAQVGVTATRLTITPKDSAGRPLRQKTNEPCGPFVVERR